MVGVVEGVFLIVGKIRCVVVSLSEKGVAVVIVEYVANVDESAIVVVCIVGWS